MKGCLVGLQPHPPSESTWKGTQSELCPPDLPDAIIKWILGGPAIWLSWGWDPTPGV